MPRWEYSPLVRFGGKGDLLAQDDAHVYGRYAAGEDDERVDLDLGQVREVRRELRDAEQRLHDHAPVRRWEIAEATEPAAGPRAVHERLGLGAGERREREGDVAECLHLDAPRAEHHKRPEQRIPDRAD